MQLRVVARLQHVRERLTEDSRCRLDLWCMLCQLPATTVPTKVFGVKFGLCRVHCPLSKPASNLDEADETQKFDLSAFSAFSAWDFDEELQPQNWRKVWSLDRRRNRARFRPSLCLRLWFFSLFWTFPTLTRYRYVQLSL